MRPVSNRSRTAPIERARRTTKPRVEICEERVLLQGSELYINSISVVRTNAQTQTAEFQVSLSPPNIQQSVTVNFSTANGTAIAGLDYIPVSGTLSFPPATTTETVDVTLISIPGAGGVDQPQKSFLVNLSGAQNATIHTGSGTGTIDYSQAAGVVEFASPTYQANSIGGVATIGVSRYNGFASGASVDYATSNGTAIAGVDYSAASGTVSFALGQLSTSFPVTILPRIELQGSKTVNLTLSNPAGGAALGAVNPAALSIESADPLIVTNTSDGGLGSLRGAILFADSLATPSEITFDIPGTGPFVISPHSPLPAVTGATTIDASTQPGYAGTPIVDLNGAAAGTSDGLDLSGGNDAVKGLAINGFSGSGIVLMTAGNDLIQGDLIGTNLSGNASDANGGDGIAIVNSTNNVIGGTAPGQGNILSGNGFEGVEINGQAAAGNVLLGNLIGVGRDGSTPIGNAYDGVFIDQGSSNLVGGTTAGAANVIAANRAVGVQILGPQGGRNVIQGNLIGLNAAGTSDLGNSYDGIYVDNSPNNVIGGTSAAARNVISGNHETGIRIQGANASGNFVAGNWIGTDISGERGLGDSYDGIFVFNAPDNTIGGSVAGAGNVVAANGGSGIQLYGSGSSGNLVLGNEIGVDSTGMNPLGNKLDGVFINDAPRNTVGGTSAGSANLISANQQVGIQLFNRGTLGNVVIGNLVGVNAAGRPVLGNGFGVFINGASLNTVGGSGTFSNNIAGNRRGAFVRSASSTGPLVTSVTPIVENEMLTGVLVGFNQTLSANRAQITRNYYLKPIGKGPRSTRYIPFQTAVYDPIGRTVLLTPAGSTPPFGSYRFGIDGRPNHGVTGSNGRYIDGDKNGLPGGNFSSVLSIDPTTTTPKNH